MSLGFNTGWQGILHERASCVEELEQLLAPDVEGDSSHLVGVLDATKSRISSLVEQIQGYQNTLWREVINSQGGAPDAARFLVYGNKDLPWSPEATALVQIEEYSVVPEERDKVFTYVRWQGSPQEDPLEIIGSLVAREKMYVANLLVGFLNGSSFDMRKKVVTFDIDSAVTLESENWQFGGNISLAASEFFTVREPTNGPGYVFTNAEKNVQTAFLFGRHHYDMLPEEDKNAIFVLNQLRLQKLS